MESSKARAGRVRWNSLYVKLSALIAVGAVMIISFTALIYARSSSQLVETELAHSAAEINGLLANVLGEAVQLRAPGPIEREFDSLVTQDVSAVRFAIAVDGGGKVLSARGRSASDERALIELALSALAAGAAAASDTMVANPVFNAMTGKPVGAIATSWTAEFALDAARRTQRSKIIVVSSAILATMALVMALFRHWVSRPMVSIARSVDAMAGDDLDVDIGEARRGDELGDIGRSLTALRNRLLAGRIEARENRFRGIAFASSSAAVMMVDETLRISSVNAKLQHILTRYVADFQRMDPDFDPESVVGQEIDVFHSPALSARVKDVLSDTASLPCTADIAIGDARFQLAINRVDSAEGGIEGFVIEWTDVTSFFMTTAVLNAIEANQVKAEFGTDGTLLQANAHFAASFGAPVTELLGRNRDELFVRETSHEGEGGSALDPLNDGRSVYGSFASRRADGSEGVIDGGFTPVVDTSGRLLRVVLIGADRSEAKLALDQAEAERLQLERTRSNVVDTLRKSLEVLANGDLTGRITEAFPETYEQLRTDFNLAVDRFQAAMRGVVENADLIQGEASEISSAADDLSARTERQAATLEQTASALDELTTSVKSAAEGAAHANALVETARENAEASGAVVREAVDAMGEIEASSQQISKITGVIDDIAFQTNLLALNAGVEAARAGEAGRGFAVVASEVRALAQRSSDAAREINALISASGGQVKRGVNLVDQAGAALKGIVESVKEISQNVSEIAVSSREQSVGLAEINSAMNQLDHVTQQNAAMFEETTAASHALTREAETLTATMDRFQIGGRSATPTNVVSVAAADLTSRRIAASPLKRAVGEDPVMPPQVAKTDDDDGWDEF